MILLLPFEKSVESLPCRKPAVQLFNQFVAKSDPSILGHRLSVSPALRLEEGRKNRTILVILVILLICVNELAKVFKLLGVGFDLRRSVSSRGELESAHLCSECRWQDGKLSKELRKSRKSAGLFAL